jgi:hypothetical protein
MPAKISTARNLEALLELHLSHDHWNFKDIAKKYQLILPNPVPECYACLMAKPRAVARDVLSSRLMTRPCQGFAADAKGPINTPTPEGYLYFFVIVCLYSHYHWVVLAKSVGEWAGIWMTFVKRVEARSGSNRAVSIC